MLKLLASFLLLGLFPQAESAPQPPPLDDSRLLAVHSPADVPTGTMPNISASGALLMDIASGEIVFSKSADTPRAMASLTKIMTALILMENHSMDEIVTVPPEAAYINGSALGLKPGSQFVLGDLIKAMLLPSANDVAYTLALYHSKSTSAFVKIMNKRAVSLGLAHTHFGNPAGLDQKDQFASPRDLAWLTVAALRHPLFQQIVSLPESSVKSLDGTVYDLKNTNEILHSQPNVFGVKTGTTGAAGECLIVLFTEGRRSYALVLLGSHERYTDALALMKALDTRIASAAR